MEEMLMILFICYLNVVEKSANQMAQLSDASTNESRQAVVPTNDSRQAVVLTNDLRQAVMLTNEARQAVAC